MYDDPALGGFQNYLYCRVRGDRVLVSVMKPGGVKPPDVVEWKLLNTLKQAKANALVMDTVGVGAGRPASRDFGLRFGDGGCSPGRHRRWVWFRFGFDVNRCFRPGFGFRGLRLWGRLDRLGRCLLEG